MQKQQWHEWRSGGIGASDAPSIMGVSPWKTYHQLWGEKVFGESTQKENAAMRRGKELESAAIQFFEMETGVLVEEQVCLEHPTLNWMRATLDGYNADENVLVEVKTTRVLHEQVPEHYYPQLQHQMAVAGLKSMFYVSFDGHDGKILKVNRDDNYVKELVEKEEEFWRLVQNKEEPLLEAHDFKDMGNNKEWKYLAERYYETQSLISQLQEEAKFLESQFILFSKGHKARGHGIVLSQITRKGNISYKEIPEIQSVDLEQYRNPPTTYWRVITDKKRAI